MQLGYTNLKLFGTAPKIVVLAACLLSVLIFAHYNADLTSLMTSGPRSVKIESFEDALASGYRFFVWPETSFEALMKNAPKGIETVFQVMDIFVFSVFVHFSMHVETN